MRERGGGGVVRKLVGGKGFLFPGNSKALQTESNLNINSFRRGHFTFPPIRDTELTLGERVGFKLHLSVVIRSLFSLAFVCTENMVGQ